MNDILILADSKDKLDSPILKQSLAQVGLSGRVILKELSSFSHEKCDVIITLGQQTFNTLMKQYDQQLHDVHSYVFKHNGIPVIPTFSPSQIFEQPDRHHWLNHALTKAKNYIMTDSNTTLLIEPTLMEIRQFAERAARSPQLSIDIECIRETCELTAIAFALNPTESMSIPLAREHMENYWSEEEEAAVWQLISQMISLPNAKIFQNYMFDCMILDHFGLTVKGPIEDTLWIANLLYPELPKGLKDLGRQYLYCEPWKTMKDFTLSGDAKAFWRYNALDAARTFAIYEKQQAEIDVRNLRTFYDMHIKPLHNVALDSCQHGIAVDHNLYESFKATIGALSEPLKQELIEIATPLIAPLAKRNRKRNKSKDIRGPSTKTGKEIVLIKGYDETIEPFNASSPPQVKLVLKALGYRIPIKDGKETTDQIALLKLQRKAPHAFLEKLIILRKYEKVQSSYLNIPFDSDGRCRYSFNRARDNDNNLGTKSGRFGCSQTPWNTGLNIQTIPRKDPRIPIILKNIFVADEGEELLEVDLSQAELRIVAWLSGDQKLIKQLDAGEDIHQFMADEIKRMLHVDANRQFGKFVNHATAYGMGKYKFCDKALKDLELVITPDLAQKVIDLRMQTYPMLKLWQQNTICTVKRTRRLVSPQGRERFFFGQFDDNMEREALSFVPQATVVDSLNRSWIQLSQLPQYNKEFRILTQVHDSLLFALQKHYKPSLVVQINSIFSQQSFTINGMSRVIPHDIKVTKELPGWGNLKAL